MGTMIGISLIFGGIAGCLFSWQKAQKERRQRVAAFVVFLQQSVFAMETENARLEQLFLLGQKNNGILQETLREIVRRLRLNIYPQGKMIWETVFCEKEKEWDLDEETFSLLLHAGNGFFGKNRAENICFLQKSIEMLERQEIKNKEKDKKEQKVWIPVGMLGGLMLVIFFL